MLENRVFGQAGGGMLLYKNENGEVSLDYQKRNRRVAA